MQITLQFFVFFFELQNCPILLSQNVITYNVVSAIVLDENTVSIDFKNCRHTGAVLDLGVENSATCLPNGYDYSGYEKA